VLPPSLIANILSYNLHNLVDVARLRELNQIFGPMAVSLIPSLVPKSGHFLPTSDETNGFVHQLMTYFEWDAKEDLEEDSEEGSEEDSDSKSYWDYYNYSRERDQRAAHDHFTMLWEHYQKKPVQEGVAIVDGLVSNELETLLNSIVQSFVLKQEQDGTVDYHPNSSNVVRDLVHPALYSYVSGVSRVVQLPPFEPCHFPSLQEASVASEVQRDFWGRKYEDSKYQWLSTTFSIGKDGSCIIEDYINNLTLRDAHHDLYASLAKLFEQCLSFTESVYAYIGSIQPHLRREGDGVDHDGRPLPSSREKQYVSF